MSTRSTNRARNLALVIIAIPLAHACAATPPTPDTPAAPAPAAAAAGPAERHGPDHTEADVRFVHHMLMHHAQALDMTALVPERAASDAIRLLAERIEVSQRDEIALMQQWLRRRGEPVPTGGMDHGGGSEGSDEHAEMHARHHPAGGGAMTMPGMLTPEEMARLEAASGREFDRLFLESMIRHHEGALEMVAELFATPGAGQEPAMYQLASEIESDQRMEIDRMRQMLEAYDQLSSNHGAPIIPAGPARITLQRDTR